MTTYVVKAGDTGDMIANEFHITFAVLSAANPSVNWDNLQVGQVLAVPASLRPFPYPSSYTVKAGDTATSIAAHYQFTVEFLEISNPGVDWNDLQIGQVLFIPYFPFGPPVGQKGSEEHAPAEKIAA